VTRRTLLEKSRAIYAALFAVTEKEQTVLCRPRAHARARDRYRLEGLHVLLTAASFQRLTVGAMRLLADRGTGGISVRLFWDEAADGDADIVVEYEDRNEGLSFEFRPPRERALDAFYHPNAYAGLEAA
jgi:hypothetical protein